MLFSSSTRDKLADRVADRAGDVGDSTSKIMDDLASLRDRVAKLGKAKASDLSDQVSDVVGNLGGKAQDQASALADNASDYLQAVDGSLRRRPYPFVIGAVAVGLIIGLTLPNLLRGES